MNNFWGWLLGGLGVLGSGTTVVADRAGRDKAIKDPAEHMGQATHNIFTCSFFKFSCEGIPQFSILTNLEAGAKWVLEKDAANKWKDWSYDTVNVNLSSGATDVVIAIQAIKEIDNQRLTEVTTNGALIAHIRLLDLRTYAPLPASEINVPGESLKNDFFAVIDPVTLAPIPKDSISVKIGKWHLVGIDTTNIDSPKLKKLSGPRVFRFCRYAHDPYEREIGSGIKSCATSGSQIIAASVIAKGHTSGPIMAAAHKLVSDSLVKPMKAILRQRDLALVTARTTGDSTALDSVARMNLRGLLGSFGRKNGVVFPEGIADEAVAEGDGVWVTCGIGCCSGDVVSVMTRFLAR